MIDDEQTRLTDEHQPPSKWNPDRLAREAEVASPNTANSAGASYLLAIRDAAVALIDESDPNQAGDADWWHEHVHGVADGVIPDDTHNRWLIFTDLCLWEEEVHVEGNVKTIHGDDYVLFNALCTTALYEAAHRLAWLICTTVESDEIDEADDL